MPEGERTVVVSEAFEIVGGTLIVVEELELPGVPVLVVLVVLTVLVSTGGGGRTLNCGTLPPMLNPLMLSGVALIAGRGLI
jgi:hypothetical protein